MLFRFLYLVLFFLSQIEGFQIISDITQSGYINSNGVHNLISTRYITIEVFAVDWGVNQTFTLTNSSGQTQTVIFNPGPISTAYTSSIQGYVFEDGLARTPDICLSRDPARYNPTSAQLWLNQSGDTGMYVQRVVKKTKFSLESLEKSLKNTANRLTLNKGKLKLQLGPDSGGLDNTQSFELTTFSGAIPVFGGLAAGVTCLVVGCGDDISPVSQQDFNAFSSASDARLDALNQTYMQLENWTTSVTDNIGSLNQRLNTTQLALSSMQSNYAALQNQANAQLQMDTAVNAALSSQVNTVQTNLLTATGALASLGNTLTADSGSFNAATLAAFNQINNLTNYINLALANLTTVFSNRLVLDETKLRSLVSIVNQLASNVRDIVLAVTEKRFITRAVQTDIWEINTTTDYVPFLTNFGQQPATSLGQYAAVYIDTITETSVFNNGSYYANQIVQNVFCDTLYYLSYTNSWNTYQDILYSLVAGCNSTLPGSCRCWFTWQQTTCPSNSTLSSGRAFTNLPNNSFSGLCVSANVTSPQIIVSNVTQYFNLHNSICVNQVAVGGTWVTSYTTRSAALAPYTSTICTGSLTAIFEGAPNYIFSQFLFLETSFSIAASTIDIYYNYIDGMIPDDLTFTRIPFTYRNGVPVDCLVANYMAYSQDILPVYELSNPTTPSATFTMYLDGVPLSTSAVTLSIPNLNILGGGLIRLVGDPLSTTVVYDAPQESVSFGRNPRERTDTLTYGLHNASSCMTLACWKQFWNTSLFDQTSGTVVPREYKRSVDPVTGLCEGAQLGSYGISNLYSVDCFMVSNISFI